MKSRDDIIAAAFAAIDPHLRRASVAQIGGFRPGDEPVTSFFGGRFVGRADEAWPMNGGEPMIPLIQVRVDELPHRPEAIAGIALFNVFIGPRELPIDLPAENGKGWLLRSYASLQGLAPLASPAQSYVRPFPVRWQLSTTDAPQRTEAGYIHDLSAFDRLENADDVFNARYDRCYQTKIGGWPTYIQGELDSEDYVFQIGSEEKPNWMWGDNGNGYFYLRNGVWFMDWDCY